TWPPYPIADLKQAHRVTWASGDYAAVAEHIDEVPPAHLLGRVLVGAGEDVLDVAAGMAARVRRGSRAGPGDARNARRATARARLEAEGTWLECRSEIVTLIERWDEGGVVGAEYLVAVGKMPA